MMQHITVPTRTQGIEASVLQGTQLRFHASTSKWLGGAHMAIGITSILLDIQNSGFYTFGNGIWCGTFFIVAGSFGIAAEKTRRTVFIDSSMVLSIMAASLFASALLTCAANGHSVCNAYMYPYFYHECEVGSSAEGLLLTLAILEVIIAVISSVKCCRSFCGPYAYTGGQLLYSPASGGRMVLKTAGQPQSLLLGIAASVRTEAQSESCLFQAVRNIHNNKGWVSEASKGFLNVQEASNIAGIHVQTKLQRTVGNPDQAPLAYPKMLDDVQPILPFGNQRENT